jgi:hypothetical protein
MSLQTIQRNLGRCLVCGHPAIGMNFAVPTCAPCKAFFRRNAIKLGVGFSLDFSLITIVFGFQRIDFACPVDGNCPITSEYRRMCNCCRLAKCFRVGMQKSMILSASEKEARKDLIQQNREKRAQLAKKVIQFIEDKIYISLIYRIKY